MDFIISNFTSQYTLNFDFKPNIKLTVMALLTYQLVESIKQLLTE